MKKIFIAAMAALAMPLMASAQIKVNISIDAAPRDSMMIPKEIYGQFAEHLGACIYGGLWVGPESEIPNTDGYRNDVLEALKTLKVPVMRWPCGCFRSFSARPVNPPCLRPSPAWLSVCPAV